MNHLEEATIEVINRETGHFESSLFDKNNGLISEELAEQILSRVLLEFYEQLISGYIPSNYKTIYDAKILGEAIKTAQNTYKNKKDTLLFDLNVKKLVNILEYYVRFDTWKSGSFKAFKCTKILPLNEEKKLFIEKFNSKSQIALPTKNIKEL
ncbi:MAG: hypothetical protein WCR30_01860 [Clostridia bacterium]